MPSARHAGVPTWFGPAMDSVIPEADGMLVTAQRTAETLTRGAEVTNTHCDHRADGRCGGPRVVNLVCPLPAWAQNIAAFLAAQLHRSASLEPLSANALCLRVAAIRYL
jgi:hypothetical protein